MTGASVQLPELRGRQDRRHAHRSGSVPAYHLLDARATGRSQQLLLAVAGRARADDGGLAAPASPLARLLVAPLRRTRARRGRRGRRQRRRRGGRGGRGRDAPESRDELDVQAQHFLALLAFLYFRRNYVTYTTPSSGEIGDDDEHSLGTRASLARFAGTGRDESR